MNFKVVPASGLTSDVVDSLYDADRHGHSRDPWSSVYCERAFFVLERIPELNEIFENDFYHA